MEESTPNAATFAGSAARTFEYRTTGVLSPPHLRWSYSPPLGKQLSCSILVAQGAVYVGDSAGYFSALDVRSGDLQWSFSADEVEGPQGWRRDSDYFSGVIAACLVGSLGYVLSAKSCLRRGYTTYTASTLTELELPSGRVLHCWDCEELLVERGAALRDDLLFFDSLTSCDDQLLLSTPVETFCFSPTAAWFADGPLPIGTWPNNRILTLYQSPAGRGPNVLYGFGGPHNLYGFDDAGDAQFGAVELPGYGSVEEHTPARTLWQPEHFYVHGAELDSIDDDAFPPSILHGWGTYSSGRCGFGCNQAIMRRTLYALGWQWEDPDKVGVVPVLESDAPGTALFMLALDPVTGMSKWRYPCPTLGQPIQLAAADQLLFLLSPLEAVAFSVQTSEPTWRWQADFEVRHGLIADGLLYVLGAQGQITALDLYPGQVRWSWQVAGEIVRAFSAIDQGTLYIATPTTLFAVS